MPSVPLPTAKFPLGGRHPLVDRGRLPSAVGGRRLRQRRRHPGRGVVGLRDGEVGLEMLQPDGHVRMRAGPGPKGGRDGLGVVGREPVPLEAERLADRGEAGVGLVVVEDLPHPLLGGVDRPSPQVRPRPRIRIVGKPEELDDPLTEFSQGVRPQLAVDPERRFLGVEHLPAPASLPTERTGQFVRVLLVGQRQRDRRLPRPMPDEVGRLDLGEPEEGHLDGVKEARFPRADVAGEDRDPGSEREGGRLVAADVAEGQRSQLERHGASEGSRPRACRAPRRRSRS